MKTCNSICRGLLLILTIVELDTAQVHAQSRASAPVVPPAQPAPGANPPFVGSAGTNKPSEAMTSNGMSAATNQFTLVIPTNADGMNTNAFLPLGGDRYYRRGTNVVYRRGTNGFFRTLPNGGGTEFIPDGDEIYRAGPDGVFHLAGREDRRGVYRNGVLTSDTNGLYDRDGGRGIYRNGVLTMDTNETMTNGVTSGATNSVFGTTNH